MPASSFRTPKARLTEWFVSASTGCVISWGNVVRTPNQALCEKNESVLTPMTSISSSPNSDRCSWKPRISVGQTKVKSSGYHAGSFLPIMLPPHDVVCSPPALLTGAGGRRCLDHGCNEFLIEKYSLL